MSGVGAAIEVARRAAGLTQAELAERSGVQQGPLSRYENDLRDPSDEILGRIAKVLGVTPDLLRSSHKIRGGIAADAHARRRATAKVGTWRQMEARLNMHRLHLARLYEEIELRAESPIPTFDPFETTPEDAARFVRMQWRMPIGPVRSLTQWLEAGGIFVVFDGVESSRVDGLSQWANDHPIMVINGQAPVDRRRFTMAHELGHLVLHADEMTDDPEQDANRFASEFLMPEDVIRPQLRSITVGKLIDLKRVWGVSMAALIERAHHLGMVGATQRSSLYKTLSSKGWRTIEPGSDELGAEEAKLAGQIASAFAERGLTSSEVARITGYDEDAPNPFAPPDRSLRIV